MTLLFIILIFVYSFGFYFIFENPYYIPLIFILGALASFLTLVIIVLIVSIFFTLGKPTSKFKNFFLRTAFKYCLNMLGVKMEVVNQENLPNHNNFVLYPNHKSYCDAFVLFCAVGKPISSVSKKEVVRIPILHRFMKGINVISLDREDDRKALEQIILAIRNLKNGPPMIIFPEGGRKNKEIEKMVDIKAGAYKLAMKNQADIIPVTLVNMTKIKHNYFRRRTHVKVVFNKPITYEEYKNKKTIEIGQEVFDIINNTIDSYEKKNSK